MFAFWLFSLMLLLAMLILREKLTHQLGLLWLGYSLFLFIAFLYSFFNPKPVSLKGILAITVHHVLLIGISLRLERLHQDFKNLAQQVALSAPQRKEP